MTANEPTTNREDTVGDFYLPAFAFGPDLERVESFFSDLFDHHGVVLVPKR